MVAILGTLLAALTNAWPCDEAKSLVKNTADEFAIVRHVTEAPKDAIRDYLKKVKKELVATTSRPTHLEWLIDELLDTKCASQPE